MLVHDQPNLARWPVADLYDRVWSKASDAAIDELISPQLNCHLAGDVPGLLVRGRAQFRDLVQAWHTGFSDMIETPFAAVCDGANFSVAFRFEGTHSGPFEGIAATGKRVSMTGIDMFRIVDGQILEWICTEDLGNLLMELRGNHRPD